jgi:hypothetical protein
MEQTEAIRRSFLRTHTGKNVYPLAMTAEMIEIEDIAHALSFQCRFSGHTKFFYSVAQHSVLVSHHLMHLHNDPEIALSGLLHDAAEAYLVDLPTPLKRLLADYGPAEHAIQRVIEAKFQLKCRLDDSCVAWVDRLLLATEARDLMGDPQDWASLYGIKPLDERIVCWPSGTTTRTTFLQAFRILQNKRSTKGLQ